MQNRFGKWLIVWTLIAATGGHWALLQSAAWVGMFVSFSQTEPVLVALEKTFDGQNPCSLCKAVEVGKKSEKKQAMQKLEIKPDFWLVRNVSVLFPPRPSAAFPAEPDSAQPRAESPPTPPPRLV